MRGSFLSTREQRADTNFTVNGLTITSTLTGTDTPTNVERIALIDGVGDNKLVSTDEYLAGVAGN